MAAEILKLIEQTLVVLPAGHPERRFWELQQEVFQSLINRRRGEEALKQISTEMAPLEQGSYSFDQEQLEWLRGNSYRVIDVRDLSVREMLELGLQTTSDSTKTGDTLRSEVCQVAVNPDTIFLYNGQYKKHESDDNFLKFNAELSAEVSGLTARRADLPTMLQLEYWFQKNEPGGVLFTRQCRVRTSSLKGDESYHLDRSNLDRSTSRSKIRILSLNHAIHTADLPVIYKKAVGF